MIPVNNIHVRTIVTWIAILMMYAGFLLSRAVLSTGTILFIANALLQNNWKQRWINFLADKKSVFFTFLFWIPFLTFFWSADKSEWAFNIQGKLPLLLFPLVFAMPVIRSKKEMLWLSFLFILFITGGTIWSIIQYLPYAPSIDAGYYKGLVMLTPSSRDYIRFSWAINIAILLAARLLTAEPLMISKAWRIILTFIISWLIIYLHILSSKTGILGLYLIAFIFFSLRIYATKKKWRYIPLILFLLAAPFIAYNTLPTFKLRTQYVHWDYSHYSKGEYAEGLSDATRINSFNAGWDILKNKWIGGVGFGDIKNEATEWYSQHTPWVSKPEMISPSSEILMYGCGAGFTGAVVLIIVLLIPFFQKKQSPVFYCFHALCLFAFLYEAGLDMQYGVFLYGFFSFWFTDRKVAEG